MNENNFFRFIELIILPWVNLNSQAKMGIKYTFAIVTPSKQGRILGSEGAISF